MVAGYATLSTSHLRHWARQKDAAAKKLYPLKARGSGVLLTLELLRAFSFSAVVILVTNNFGIWQSWAIISVLLFVAFIVLTQLYLKPFGIRLLVWLSSPLLALTNGLKPIMLPLGRLFYSFLDEEPVTLTKEELQRMLEAVSPEDTDLSEEELRILESVLTYSARTVHDIMIPKSKVVTVPVGEALTPIVLDGLYKTGHAHFPVMGDDKKTVVGMLNMHDIMDINRHPSVEAAMQQKVYFVDEDRGLDHALEVFYKTKQTVFVVHNSASDMVGIITMEDILQQILGKPGAKEHHKPVEPENLKVEDTGSEQAAVVEWPL